VGKVNDTLDGLNLAVLPETDVLRGDSSFRSHGGGLNGDKTRSALDDTAKVSNVPVGHVSVLSRILAQRREHDTVLHRQTTNLERLEELGDCLAIFRDESSSSYWVLKRGVVRGLEMLSNNSHNNSILSRLTPGAALLAKRGSSWMGSGTLWCEDIVMDVTVAIQRM